MQVGIAVSSLQCVVIIHCFLAVIVHQYSLTTLSSSSSIPLVHCSSHTTTWYSHWHDFGEWVAVCESGLWSLLHSWFRVGWWLLRSNRLSSGLLLLGWFFINRDWWRRTTGSAGSGNNRAGRLLLGFAGGGDRGASWTRKERVIKREVVVSNDCNGKTWSFHSKWNTFCAHAGSLTFSTLFSFLIIA